MSFEDCVAKIAKNPGKIEEEWPIFANCLEPMRVASDIYDPEILAGKNALIKEFVGALFDVQMSALQVRKSLRLLKRDGLRFTRLYHYTRKSTFQALFPIDDEADTSEKQSAKVLLASVESLNDPNEGKFFFRHLIKGLAKLKLTALEKSIQNAERSESRVGKNINEPVVFSASFCNSADNLNLWRFYGDDASGVSFGIPLEEFDCESNDDQRLANENITGTGEACEKEALYRIGYGEQRVQDAIRTLTPSLNTLSKALAELEEKVDERVIASGTASFLSIMRTIAFLFKSSSYSDEHEFRVIRIARLNGEKSESNIIPSEDRVYFKSQIDFISKEGSTVTIGPSFNENLEAAQMEVRYRLSRSKSVEKPPRVLVSSQEYRGRADKKTRSLAVRIED